MKKTKLLMASALLVGLCGCTDAQAKLKDSSTAVMSVGSQNITKGEIFSVLSSAYGANAVINDAVSRICAAEVEITDEMRTEAEGSLESMKALYGDSFQNYLESSGMSEEDYINEVILPSQQPSRADAVNSLKDNGGGTGTQNPAVRLQSLSSERSALRTPRY